MKIYTRGGDTGATHLGDGSRVRKDALRVAACGDLDELNAALGLVRSHPQDERRNALLLQVQRDLFALGAQVADPGASVAGRQPKAALRDEHVLALERAIDDCEAGLPALRAFVLPGGSPAGAALHLARAVCRRAERSLVALDRDKPVDPLVLAYVNRLSDLLFVMARQVNLAGGQREDTW